MQRNLLTTLARLGRLVNAQPLRMKLESLHSRPRQANMTLPFAQPEGRSLEASYAQKSRGFGT